MFYIFGIASKKLGVVKLDSTCEHCGSSELLGEYRQSYFHIFFIPIIPMFKSSAAKCTHCKKNSSVKELRNDDTIEQLELYQRKMATPLSLYLGLFIMAILLLYAVHSGRVEANQTLSYLQYPRVGDCYVVSHKGIQDNNKLHTVFTTTDVKHGNALLVPVAEFKTALTAKLWIKKNKQCGEHDSTTPTITLDLLAKMDLAPMVYFIQRSKSSN